MRWTWDLLSAENMKIGLPYNITTAEDKIVQSPKVQYCKYFASCVWAFPAAPCKMDTLLDTHFRADFTGSMPSTHMVTLRFLHFWLLLHLSKLALLSCSHWEWADTMCWPLPAWYAIFNISMSTVSAGFSVWTVLSSDSQRLLASTLSLISSLLGLPPHCWGKL